MQRPDTYTFSRYLAAKKSVDDRALNHHVYHTLAEAARDRYQHGTMHILEIGAGIGTMIERLLDWNLIAGGTRLTAIEPDMQNVQAAILRLNRFADARGHPREAAGKLEVKLAIPDRPTLINFQTVNLERYAASHAGPGRLNLVIAHAVLDLLNLPEAIPAILKVAAEECLLYFTLNFDGATIFEPEIDLALDRLIEELYHQTMDQRVTDGRPSGDRHTGRHLFQRLKENGIEVVAAGSSDWVVFPGPHGYPEDEAYFLHFIIHTMASALKDHPALDPGRFAAWIEERHRQIERGELVYIAHQIDIFGRR